MPVAAAVVGGVGSLFGGIFGASSASKTAKVEAQASEQAAELQHQDAQAALDWQRQVFGIQQAEGLPWLNIGRNAAVTLSQLMGLPTTANIGGGISGGTAGAFRGGLDAGFGGGTEISPAGFGGDAFRSIPALDDGSGFTTRGAVASPAFNRGQFLLGTHTPPTVLDANGNPTISASGSPAIARDPNFNPLAGPNVPTGTGYLQPFKNWDQQFVAPTDVTEQNDPGFKFRLKQGQDALERSAAARGGLLTGGTAAQEGQFAQDYASNEYSNVYNRNLGEYQQNYNIFQQNQNQLFNRLAALSGFGQTEAGQLNSAGTSSASNVGNILLGSGGQIGQSLQNIGAARGSGYVGASNALSAGISGLGNSALLAYILGKGGSGGGTPSYPTPDYSNFPTA